MDAAASLLLRVVLQMIAQRGFATVSVDISGSPVPVSLESLSVLVTALLNEGKAATVATSANAALALMSDRFRQQISRGRLSVLSLWMPKNSYTLGYVVGFAPAAYVACCIRANIKDPAANSSTRFLIDLACMSCGHGVILVCGASWLRAMGTSNAVQKGVTPFFPGMLLKSIAGAALSSRLAPQCSREANFGWLCIAAASGACLLIGSSLRDYIFRRL
mmetsp:Transcript_11964/g.32356  ORF Transcript_11964/g.32356 Transcript_11964/m.32356 type:complete len:219 (+) Transcript_11964:123-779(+)